MIIDKITVLFFKVKLIDSYYVFGGAQNSRAFVSSKRPIGNEDYGFKSFVSE